MKEPNNNTSSEKENKKVKSDDQFKDNEVKEGTDASVNTDDSNKTAYPHDDIKDKQYNSQPEYIDRNNDSKDKS